MKFVLAVPFLTLFFAPQVEASAIKHITTTQIQCDGPYPMTTILNMIESAAKKAQEDLIEKCVFGNHPGDLPGKLTGRQKLEHFSVEGGTITCVTVTVSQSCYVN